jgi:hypothetical protein
MRQQFRLPADIANVQAELHEQRQKVAMEEFGLHEDTAQQIRRGGGRRH